MAPGEQNGLAFVSWSFGEDQGMIGQAFSQSMAHDQELSPPPQLLTSELDFYDAYPWCLNAYPTVGDIIQYLGQEIERLQLNLNSWQTDEVALNVFLLSCGLLNAAEEYLRGSTPRIPVRVMTRLGRGATWLVEALCALEAAASVRLWSRRRAVRRWKQRCQSDLDDFLAIFVKGQPASFAGPASRLKKLLLSMRLPPDLQAKHVGTPTLFRRLDTTHFDILALGQRFVDRFPDRSEAILIVGLRTSGSYLAPLLKAYLKTKGYHVVVSLTIHPGKGPGRQERQELQHCARQGFTALIVDDSPHTAGTIVLALDTARRAGFPLKKLKALVPTHAAKRDGLKILSDNMVISLEPEQWHKQRLLDPALVERRLAEYFHGPDIIGVRLVASEAAAGFNARLRSLSSGDRGARLKRVYEVHLDTKKGKEIRYILAKSVGWGWLGYHAFLAGHRLSGFVPPIIGLRDGILYMNWYPQSVLGNRGTGDRQKLIETFASYVATRARSLALSSPPASGKSIKGHEDGFLLLRKALAGAYPWFSGHTLMRRRLERRLSRERCPQPTLIDGKMGDAEWIVGPNGLLKIDYEHHGMGKSQLNTTDPAYDLAETILSLALSPEEERELIRRYVEMTEDLGLEQRLFLNKLLAGLWTMSSAQEHLFCKPQPAEMQQLLHEQFMGAWHFLTEQTARFCGALCQPARDVRWQSPLVALDVDGVLDRRCFGFPSTSGDGIEAVSLLGTHGFCVALNTARSLAEVKAYCQAFGFAGGVAEYGGYMWDAVDQRGQVLISNEARRQLAELRVQLRQIPGVFLDDRHQYSIRAFTYQAKPRSILSVIVSILRGYGVGPGTPTPLPPLVIDHLITKLGLDRLSIQPTTIDTTIVAKETDKGTGLTALRDWVLHADAETIAIGDSQADLPMFRVAQRCFAPAQIDCAPQALLLGCQIAQHSYQRGLLDIARHLVHPDGRQCDRCSDVRSLWPRNNLFVDILQAADRSAWTTLMRAMLRRELAS
jgi:hydroxymethylpyrimidine pyrophosphatase-like HAD family hydrolase